MKFVRHDYAQGGGVGAAEADDSGGSRAESSCRLLLFGALNSKLN